MKDPFYNIKEFLVILYGVAIWIFAFGPILCSGINRSATPKEAISAGGTIYAK